MTIPKRLWRRRTKGWRAPSNTLMVSRPSEFSSHIRIRPEGDWCGFEGLAHDRGWAIETDGGIWRCSTLYDAHLMAVRLYREWWNQPQQEKLRSRFKVAAQHKEFVGCFCSPELACHVDVLLESLK